MNFQKSLRRCEFDRSADESNMQVVDFFSSRGSQTIVLAVSYISERVVKVLMLLFSSTFSSLSLESNKTQIVCLETYSIIDKLTA